VQRSSRPDRGRHRGAPVKLQRQPEWKRRARGLDLLRRSELARTNDGRHGRRPMQELERAGRRRSGRRPRRSGRGHRLGRPDEGRRCFGGGRLRHSRRRSGRLDDRRRVLDDDARGRRDRYRRPLDRRRRRCRDRRRDGCRSRRGRSRGRQLGGRRRGRGWSHRRPGHRQERERIEVALRIPDVTDAEVHVGHVELDGPTRAGRADLVSFRDRVVFLHAERAQVRQAHGQAGRSLDRDGLSVRCDRAGEADDAACGCEHRRAVVGADRDPSVLSRGVRMSLVEREGLEERAAHGPRPGARAGHEEHERERNRCESSHAEPPPLLSELSTMRAHASSGAGCCQF